MTVVAETPAEVVELAAHFRIFDKENPDDLVAMAEAIKAGTLTYVSQSSKRPWYRVESALDHEFSEPYEKWLARLVSHDATLPALDLTPIHPRRLCHTHITDTAWIEDGHIQFTGFVNSEDWNGKTAADRAFSTALDYTAEDFGTRQHEPEYIGIKQRGGGLMKRNPNYLKRHPARPAASCEWLKSALFDWWMKNHATDEQRAIINGAASLSHSRYSNPVWAEYSLYVPDPSGTCNYDGNGFMARVYSWDEIKELAPVE